MTNSVVERVGQMEGVRDLIVSSLTKGGVDKLDTKTISALEKTITNGAKVAFQMQEMQMREKSEQGEAAFREQATAYIRAKREESNRVAQQVREGAVQGGSNLPEVPTREVSTGEALQGQYQVGYEVLSGQKGFVPSENLPPPPRDENLPEVP